MTGPIGVFDSGLGGLTVAAEVLRNLPDESIIYFADTAHVPYGERPLDEIERFALGITQYLINRGAKVVVMACNMSTAVALESAQETFPDIPILGVIEPGSRAAVMTGSNAIGVLATTGTVKSGAYRRAIKQLNPEAVVWEQPCSAFVPLIETGRAESEEAEAAVRKYVEPLIADGANTLILGCTHYPFLRPAIEKTAPGASIVDPAEETTRELRKILSESGILAEPGTITEHRFIASGSTDGIAKLGSRFLGRNIEHVDIIRWGVDLKPVRNSKCKMKAER
ncbi:MAG: glutamate racemase [Armatimonadota bacterium]